MNPSISRKLAHASIAIVFALAPLFVSRDIILIFAAALFGAIALAHTKNIFKTLRKVERKTWGQFFLPLGIIVTALHHLPHNVPAFQFGILVMGISDAFANIAGERFGKHVVAIFGTKKSLEGSLAFYTSTIVLLFLFYPSLNLQLFGLPLILTVVEFISVYGIDNLTLPLIAALFFGLL